MPIWGGGSGGTPVPWFNNVQLPLTDGKNLDGTGLYSVGLLTVATEQFGIEAVGAGWQLRSTDAQMGVQGTITPIVVWSTPYTQMPAGATLWASLNFSIIGGGTMDPAAAWLLEAYRRETDGTSTLIDSDTAALAAGAQIANLGFSTATLTDLDTLDIFLTLTITETGGLDSLAGLVVSAFVTNIDPT